MSIIITAVVTVILLLNVWLSLWELCLLIFCGYCDFQFSLPHFHLVVTAGSPLAHLHGYCDFQYSLPPFHLVVPVGTLLAHLCGYCDFQFSLPNFHLVVPAGTPHGQLYGSLLFSIFSASFSSGSTWLIIITVTFNILCLLLIRIIFN